MCDLRKEGKKIKRKVKSVWSDKITKIRLDKEIGHMCRNKHNKRSGKHRGKYIKSGNNECRKCPKNAKNIRKNIPCDIATLWDQLNTALYWCNAVESNSTKLGEHLEMFGDHL